MGKHCATLALDCTVDIVVQDMWGTIVASNTGFLPLGVTKKGQLPGPAASSGIASHMECKPIARDPKMGYMLQIRDTNTQKEHNILESYLGVKEVEVDVGAFVDFPRMMLGDKLIRIYVYGAVFM